MTELVKGFSSDEKNCSMEFNEFLKMMATEERKDSQPKGDALLEAFRCFFKEIHAIFCGWTFSFYNLGHLTKIVMES